MRKKEIVQELKKALSRATIGLGQRNPAISAVNRSTAIIVSVVFIVALLAKLVFQDDINRILENYTEVHSWKNHVEKELIDKLKGYVPHE